MQCACTHAECMAKTIQVRKVPDAVSKKLKARAAEADMSLSEYVLAQLARLAALPTRDELRARLQSRPRTRLAESAAKMVRRERDSA